MFLFGDQPGNHVIIGGQLLPLPRNLLADEIMLFKVVDNYF
jgi:hypothetical protein